VAGLFVVQETTAELEVGADVTLEITGG